MNDERPIEKLLRRYTKKRRDDAGTPVELHPATRRMLQGEVARRFPKRAAAGEEGSPAFAHILKSWRTRWVWVLPVLIVLGVGVWMLVGPNEKSGLEFDLAKNASAPTMPTGVGERYFGALKKTKSASPAPALSLADRATQAYANGSPARDGRASSGVPAGAAGDVPGAALGGEALRRNQGDAAVVNGLSAISDKEVGLNLETDRVAVNDFAQVAAGGKSRTQPVAVKRALVEEAVTFGVEKTQAKDTVLSASAKNDSLENFEILRKGYVSASKDKLVVAPASKPAEAAPYASASFYRQEARSVGGREKLIASSQAFVNRAPASSYGKAAKSVTMVPVLVNFQVEQTGKQLRVIDGDGSTYLGEMNLAAAGQSAAVALENNSAETLALKQEDKLAAGRLGATLLAEPRGAQKFVCRVSGTNRTLNQQVVFTWNFVALTNELAAAQVKFPSGGAGVLENNVPAQQLPLLLNNSVISGRAQLGNAREIEINAVPVSP